MGVIRLAGLREKSYNFELSDEIEVSMRDGYRTYTVPHKLKPEKG